MFLHNLLNVLVQIARKTLGIISVTAIATLERQHASEQSAAVQVCVSFRQQ
jgi:hypothetical protein